MTIDINDPSTWGEDLSDVIATALGGTNEQQPETDGDADAGADGEVDAAAPAPAPAPAKATADGPAGEPTGATAGEDGGDDEPDAPDLVTDRGSVIPARALSEARAERAAALTEAAALRAELERLRSEGRPQQPDQPPAALPDDDGWAAERAALLHEFEQAKADDDATMQRLLQTTIRQGDMIATDRAQRQQQAQAWQQADNAARDQAWAQVPILEEWHQQQPLLLNAALTLHNTLMQDQRYQALPWFDRFALLPGLVCQQLGLPEPVAEPAAEPAQAPAPRPAARPSRRAQAAGVPHSMSDLPGGVAPDPQPRGLRDLQELPASEQAAALTALYTKGGMDGLLQFLKDVPIGGLNVPGARP